MYTSAHDLSSLFAQLGLPDDPASVTRFIDRHQIAPHQPIAKADFWNTSQARFLHDALIEDAEWIEAVDLLATLMTKAPT